jgi:hypothetical protein
VAFLEVVPPFYANLVLVSFSFFSHDPSEMRIYREKNKRWEFQRVKCLQGMGISIVWVLNKITRYVKRVVNFLEM